MPSCSESRTAFRRRHVEPVHDQSDEAVVARERYRLHELLAAQLGQPAGEQLVGQRPRAEQAPHDLHEQPLTRRQSL